MAQHHTEASLAKLTADASAAALRPPMFGPDDRADCAAALLADVMAACAASDSRIAKVRHGTPRAVLAYIDATERYYSASYVPADSRRVVMPLVSDLRFTFSALRNRAHDWRRAELAVRDRREIEQGRAGVVLPPEAVSEGEHLRRLAAISFQAARRCARNACEQIGAPAGTDAEPSPTFCLMYQFARGIDPETAASELGVGFAAWRKRTSRAAADVRARYSLAEVLALLAGTPAITSRPIFATTLRRKVAANRIDAGTPIFALADESREADKPHVDISPDPRTGTNAGRWPERALTAADARSVCKTRYSRVRGAVARTSAHKRTADADAVRRNLIVGSVRIAVSADHSEVLARKRVAAALIAADARPPKSDVGRTAGKPDERYASRIVRLGIE